MKTCRSCGVEKPFDDFHRNSRHADGRTSYCKPCAIVRAAEWQKANPEKRRVTARQSHERRLASGKVREDKYKARYGITVAQYDALFMEQGGACAICKTTPSGRLHVDHDHETGRVRGLLCTRCNQGLGYFLDRADLLRAAAVYTEA